MKYTVDIEMKEVHYSDDMPMGHVAALRKIFEPQDYKFKEYQNIKMDMDVHLGTATPRYITPPHYISTTGMWVSPSQTGTTVGGKPPVNSNFWHSEDINMDTYALDTQDIHKNMSNRAVGDAARQEMMNDLGNKYDMDDETNKKIAEHWENTLENWNDTVKKNYK